MTQEDKNLLLKDLCARLPYGVKAIGNYSTNCCSVVDTIEGIFYNNYVGIDGCNFDISNIQLYLFPLSNMTEEIMDEIYEESGVYDIDVDSSFYIEAGTTFEDLTKISNILHKHHIDYRNLIQKGLAIDATGLNIY